MDETLVSVTAWIAGSRSGDRAAARLLQERYLERLVRLARKQLCAHGFQRTVSDEEGVALNVLNALCDGVERGRFPRIDDRHDLWRILVRLTADKVIDQRRRERCLERGGGRVRVVADLEAAAGVRDVELLDRAIGAEPTPEFALMDAEEIRLRLDALGEERVRRVAVLKLA